MRETNCGRQCCRLKSRNSFRATTLPLLSARPRQATSHWHRVCHSHQFTLHNSTTILRDHVYIFFFCGPYRVWWDGGKERPAAGFEILRRRPYQDRSAAIKASRPTCYLTFRRATSLLPDDLLAVTDIGVLMANAVRLSSLALSLTISLSLFSPERTRSNTSRYCFGSSHITSARFFLFQ